MRNITSAKFSLSERQFINASSRWQQKQWHAAVLSLSEKGWLFDGPRTDKRLTGFPFCDMTATESLADGSRLC
jgi:hypothetical protein